MSPVEEADCCAPTGCCSGCCCTKCCCRMPHGKIVLFPTIILSFAATLSMITLCNCKFVVPDEYAGSYYYYGAGFWPNCVYYDYGSGFINQSSITHNHRVDDMRKIAMSFGLIATIVGTGAMLGLWVITCKPYSPATKWTLFMLVLVAFISQLVTLTMLGTDYCEYYSGCTLGWGGIMSVIAAVLWLIGAIGISIIPKPKPDITSEQEIQEIRNAISEEDALPAGTITVTETMQPDGTKITEKITTHSDGNKTIERTIERPSGPPTAKAEAIGVAKAAEGP